ncbi:MAG: hypothetical protein QXH17_09910, partial [Candidatus Bathyarchaeia archaeon]
SSTAGEFAEKVRKHIPSAKITFKPDPEVLKMMGKGFGPIDDTPARREWGWTPRFDIDGMIRDFKQTYETSKK